MQSAGPGVSVDIKDSGDLDRFLRGGDLTASGTRVTADSALRNAAVFACTRIICGAVASMPCAVMRRGVNGSREPANDHWLSKLVKGRPNKGMKPGGFRRLLQMHLLMRGNAYCVKVRGVRGVSALLPLNPDRVQVFATEDGGRRYVYTRPAGGQVEYRQNEIMHLMGMSLDGITGLSVLSYARETIGLSQAVHQHGATFFANGTHCGSILKHKGQIGPQGQANLRASLDVFRNPDYAHRTLILEEGMEFERIGMTQEDAQFIETAKLTRTDIAMFFGVPPHMIGDTEKSTSWGSGIEQQQQGFVAYSLEDWLQIWEEGYQFDLVPEAEQGEIYARFNRAALVRGDISTRTSAYVSALQFGWMSPNEVRALEDMNPRAGGDEFYLPPNAAGTSNQEN